jgi:hypothetical protein
MVRYAGLEIQIWPDGVCPLGRLDPFQRFSLCCSVPTRIDRFVEASSSLERDTFWSDLIAADMAPACTD